MTKKNQGMQKRQQQQTQKVDARPGIATLANFLHARREQIRMILPTDQAVERVIKTAIMAAMENPELALKCEPTSVYRSIMQATLMGLTAGSGFNEGYFIRYGNQCTFRASYIGWSKVAKRSEGVDVIRASVAYEHDHLEMSEHPPLVEHKMRWAEGSRGKPIGAIAAAYTLTGDKHVLFDFAFVDAADLAKAKALADKNKESPSWRAWPDEMRKKVAIRRLCKFLPRNEDLNRLQRIENSADDGRFGMPDPDIDDVKAMAANIDSKPQEEKAPKQIEAKAKPEIIDSKPRPVEDKEPEKAEAKKPSRTESLKQQVMQQQKEKVPDEPQDEEGEPDYGGPEE